MPNNIIDKKDILVDNSIAKNFCNPIDPEYKRFIEWLFKSGYLVVTQKLLIEYKATAAESLSSSSMPVIIDSLIREGRLISFSRVQLNAFSFTARVKRSLRSNKKDHNHIKAVMLSMRKYALCRDNNLCYDINTFPGYSARAERRPQDLPYET